MTKNPRLPACGALVCAAAFLTSNAIAQAVTATAVAHTSLSVAASPYNQSLPAGTNLASGANLSLSAGPAFDPGSASMVISLATAPTLAYRIDAAASYSPSTPLPSPTCSYGGETLLTITPQGAPLVGILRITFTYVNGFGSGPGNASVDVGNDGSLDWSQNGSPTQTHTSALSQSGPLTIRTITNATVTAGPVTARDGDLLVDFVPTDAVATAVALTALSVGSSPNGQSLPAGTDLSSGVSLAVSAGPPYSPGSASLSVDLDVTPSISYAITNTAGSGFNFVDPPPSSGSSGQTLLTISPLAGHLSGILRITFSWPAQFPPGSASVDVGNDGTVEWTSSSTGGNPEVVEFPVAQTMPLVVRTISSAAAFMGPAAQTSSLRVEYLPRSFWNEAGDAGETRPTAQIPRGIGPMEYIAGSLGSSDCDMYWIHIDDPAAFEATTVGGTSFDSQLWLFDQRGYGVSFNDELTGSFNFSRLTGQFVHHPGNYLIAVTAWDRDARSAGGAMWLNSQPYWYGEWPPNGPGAGSPLTHWSGTGPAGTYTIHLTGASFPDLGRLIAVDGNRSLYSLDPATGAKTQIGTVSNNVGSPRDLAYDAAHDVLYMTATGPSALYTLDVDTGAATLVGPYVPGGNTWDMSIEYDMSTGRLYGARDSTLYRIDPATGLATVIGSTGFLLFSSAPLLHDPVDNRFYASVTGNHYSVDRGTGAATLIGPLGNYNAGDTTRSAETGIAYLVNFDDDTLYSLDTGTGAATAIGPTGPGLLLGLTHLPSRKRVVDYGTGCAGQGGITPVLRAVGPFPHTGAMTYELTGVAPLSLGFFAFGNDPVWVPLPFPGACPLHISPLLLIDGLFVTGPGAPGSGMGTFTVPLAASAMGMNLSAQGVVLENIDLGQLKTSNGVLILQ